MMDRSIDQSIVFLKTLKAPDFWDGRQRG